MTATALLDQICRRRPSGDLADLRRVRTDVRERVACLAPYLSDDDAAQLIANPDAEGFAFAPQTNDDGTAPTDLHARVYTAKARAAHVWANLADPDPRQLTWLRDERCIDTENPRVRPELRGTPFRIAPSILAGDPDLARTVSYVNAEPAIAIAVRSDDARVVDVRFRRIAPRGDLRLVGMVGNVTRCGDELIGCYGRLDHFEHRDVVIVEGLIDYLTALQLWPSADVLGATDAGAFPLVARHGAKRARASGGRLLLCVHADALDHDPASTREPAGETAGLRAGRFARAEGLRVDDDLIFVDLDRHQDLNAAHVAGWRPQ